MLLSTMTNPRKYRDKIKIQEEKMKMQQLEFERTMREVSPIVFPRVSVISMSNGLITLAFNIDSTRLFLKLRYDGNEFLRCRMGESRQQ